MESSNNKDFILSDGSRTFSHFHSNAGLFKIRDLIGYSNKSFSTWKSKQKALDNKAQMLEEAEKMEAITLREKNIKQKLILSINRLKAKPYENMTNH